MNRLAILASVTVLATACSQSAVQLQPGQWEMTTIVTGFQAPGASAETLAQMRAGVGQPQVSTECMTPEQAANPMQRMTGQGGFLYGCTITDRIFAGGVIRVSGSCQLPNDGGSMRISMEGNYTATTIEARQSSQTQAGPGAPPDVPRAISTTATFTARRTGDCPAGR